MHAVEIHVVNLDTYVSLWENKLVEMLRETRQSHVHGWSILPSCSTLNETPDYVVSRYVEFLDKYFVHDCIFVSLKEKEYFMISTLINKLK